MKKERKYYTAEENCAKSRRSGSARGGDGDTEITSVTADSRLVVPGALFVAVPGFKTDGAKFIDAAVSKGAAAIVSESAGPSSIHVDDARAALSLIAANFYGHPASKLSIIGVTGTSGKTSVERCSNICCAAFMA